MIRYLPKEPEKALEQIALILQDRYDTLQSCLSPLESRDTVDNIMENEMEFLQILIESIKTTVSVKGL